MKQLILLYPVHIVTVNILSDWLWLQRYRCNILDNSKSFNNYTGSSLAKLDHKNTWFSYLRYILNNLTLRESPKETGIDLKTAFRWCQRFFASALIANINEVTAIVEAKETFFSEFFKVKRYIPHRKARKYGKGGDKRKEQISCFMPEIDMVM
ncbi:MAG: transposase [Arsenophonus sp. NEOnobi-MAG3]